MNNKANITCFKKGEANPKWKGGKWIDSQGYTLILDPDAPKQATGRQRYIREHRLIWEQVHNRPLAKGWVIHHLNGIKSDNRPENLFALPRRRHDSISGQKAPSIELKEKLQRHIRELEVKNDLLKQAVLQCQLRLNIGEN